jgi:hypothetical protein
MKDSAMKELIKGVFFMFLGWYLLFGINEGSKSSSTANKKLTPNDISSLVADDISPYGDLAEIFTLGSNATDLQRTDALKKLKGKIVKWTLTVYEVSKTSDKNYRILTASALKFKDVGDRREIYNEEVSANIYLTVNSYEGDNMLLTLKTGSKICIKGVLTGNSTLRALDIEPAILCQEDLR